MTSADAGRGPRARAGKAPAAYKPSAVDLFAGCGGLTLGLKRAGFAVRGAVEIDAVASETYGMNHPEVTLWSKDIRLLDPEEMMNTLGIHKGELDLLAGCPPCQGFSTMRTLNGKRAVTDPRNELIAEFTRFVTALAPKTIMFENVPGLSRDPRMQELKANLSDMTYELMDATLDVSKYGVPQRRRRLILLASRVGSVAFARPARKIRTVRDAIGSLRRAGSGADAAHNGLAEHSERIKRLIAAIPKDGGSRSALPKPLQLACHTNFNGFKDVYGRMTWDEVSPTITGGCWNPSKGRFLHPTEDRAITLREAALLQTFPVRYKFPVSRGKSLVGMMIGNALPPEFVARHARALRRSLPTTPA